jgi:hypothetical protein
MATHAFAATRPVNPPGIEPIITEEQLWKGLEFKARNPQVSLLFHFDLRGLTYSRPLFR